ncbi:auxin response factor 18-like [Bidens hawaiensis]|uniref:auxin response factor 18-like n=1 Tax=Bidens hawaiensis TaxID=980011 RepID=UPI00404A486A
MTEAEKRVDPGLWHACAGDMIHMPLPDSYAYYFPQGHVEHTHTNVDFGDTPRVPMIPCKVIDVKFMADSQPEQVYAKIMLSPLRNSVEVYDDVMLSRQKSLVLSDKLPYFVKTLTQSDVDVNSGSLSVPWDGAEAIFPKFDSSRNLPFQTLLAKDIHGEIWRFKHVHQGVVPRKHKLTTGWNTFVNKKSLVAGDSVVFTRAENGGLCIGIRRAKVMNIGSGGRREVRPEDVVKALSSAVNSQPFEITCYPHASTPEFVVKELSVNAAFCVNWCAGMRFKMAFETDGLSRISWFTGTVSSVQDVDPVLWPKSPWRRLQVNWDDKRDLLQNVTRVSPWLVEVLSNMSSSSGFPAGIQGTRQTEKVELNLFNKHPDGLRPPKNESHDDLIHVETDLAISRSKTKTDQI